MGRYCPKEGKNRRKVTFSIRRCRFLLFILGNNVGISFFFPFHIVSCLRLRPPYVLAPCICAVPTCVHVYVRAHRARMYAPTRARSNRNVVFLLSQVSHQGRNRRQNSRFLGGDDKTKPHFFKFCPPNLSDLNERFVKICPFVM